MEFSLFANKERFFVVTLFIGQDELKKRMREIEDLGNRKNIFLTVQPCPFEGIEFLYRVSGDLVGHFVSLEKEAFWEALELNPGVPKDTVKTISGHHLNYLTAILEQNPAKVKQEMIALKGYESHFVKPITQVK